MEDVASSVAGATRPCFAGLFKQFHIIRILFVEQSPVAVALRASFDSALVVWICTESSHASLLEEHLYPFFMNYCTESI